MAAAANCPTSLCVLDQKGNVKKDTMHDTAAILYNHIMSPTEDTQGDLVGVPGFSSLQPLSA